MSTQARPAPVHAAPDPPVEPESDLVPVSPPGPQTTAMAIRHPVEAADDAVGHQHCVRAGCRLRRVSTGQSVALDGFSAGKFVTDLDRTTGNSADPLGFLPRSSAERCLQANYTVPSTDFGGAIKLDGAGDGSAWSAAHARYHDYFRELTQ